MIAKKPPFTIGIEEEYLLVERESGALAIEPPTTLFDDLEGRLKGMVRHEFMKSQVEVGTSPCRTVAEARGELATMRRVVADAAAGHGLAPVAVSTHPFSRWDKQTHTDGERYNYIADNIRGVGRRLIISGMHVHVGIDDDELRIDLMNQVSYFLPHLLALSTSSPFWQGEDTGLQSYRLCVFHELPRTGLPEVFSSYAEYQRHVDLLVRAGLIKDASFLWWDIRPSLRFPTLEVRITDVCPLLEDAAAVAALYVCLLHMLYRLRRNNQRWRQYLPMLVRENTWRAQRYELEDGLVDFGKGTIVPMAELVEEMIALTAEDAEALSCTDEVRHLSTIVKRGTSARRQRAAMARALAAGKSPEEALKAVVASLIEETVSGL